MSAPPFALPAPDRLDPPVGSAPAGGDARARAVASVAAIGAAAIAATLAIAAGLVVFEHDVIDVIARPASISDGVSVQALRDLASLPGPSPVVVAALVPAIVLLLLAALLRRLGRDAPPLRGVSPEALGAAERTMGWVVRVIAVGAFVVFVVPVVLGLVGLRTVALTTGSMAPAYPAGSLLLVAAPAGPAGLSVGEVAVMAGPDGSHVTHRVVAVVPGAAGTVAGYRTRGDALQVGDPGLVPPADVDGVVVAGVPVVGALRAWMASPLGIAIGLVLAWAFAGLGALLGDDRRRALGARATR